MLSQNTLFDVQSLRGFPCGSAGKKSARNAGDLGSIPGLGPLLGIYPKKTKILTQKCIHTPMLTAALFSTAQIWKQPKCPSIDKCGIFHI